MNARLLTVGGKLRARVREFFETEPDATAPPLELLQAALDQLERKVQPAGRGTRAFPYNRVVVHITQPGADRTAIEAVFAQLPARLRERLAEMRCDLPAGFDARVAINESSEQNAAVSVLSVECTRDADAAATGVAATATSAIAATGTASVAGFAATGIAGIADAAATAPVAARGPGPGPGEMPALRVTVITGQCGQSEYTFDEPTVIAIGRGADPTDTFGRVRRNHIAFVETRDGASETVARAHARLEFDPALHAYVIFNESSSNPTFIRRAGRSLRVAPRDPRGVRLQSGDELQLGRAVLKLTRHERTRDRASAQGVAD